MRVGVRGGIGGRVTSPRTSIPLVILALLPCVGCATGDYRRISLSADLAPGDLAHFQEIAERRKDSLEGKPIEDFIAGIPFLFAPVFLRTHETGVDRVPGTTGHFHVEDAFLTLFVLTQSIETANFGADGRNLTYESRNHLLLGLVSFSSGHRLRNTGTYGRTSSFSFFWGLFGMERTLHGRTWKVFWFPIVSGDEIPEEGAKA